MRWATVLLVSLLVLTGCGGADDAASDPTPDPTPVPSNSVRESPNSTRTSPNSTRRPVRGIDASHHQGTIDWDRVAGAEMRFAYLKATEGSSFTDPAFAANRRAARKAGMRVGGYHYFSICSPGAPQADHFATTVGDARGRGHLPPAIDLELADDCTPDRGALLTEVRTFLDAVERRTGREPVVYLYPDFEQQYGFADALADYRQWVRRLGDKPPTREWWMWQRSQTGRVPGVDGPTDINVLKR